MVEFNPVFTAVPVTDTPAPRNQISEEAVFDLLIKNFPEGKSPRPAQLTILKTVAVWLSKLVENNFKVTGEFGYLAINAPTGVGKSLLAIAIKNTVLELKRKYADFELGSVFLATEKKILQDQYEAEFGGDDLYSEGDGLYSLKGLENYPCYFDKGKNCAESKCGRIRPKSGQAPAFPDTCMCSCGYDERVQDSLNAKALLLNSAKMLNILKFQINPMRYSRPSVIIYDEGHNVESLLDSEATVDLSSSFFKRIQDRIESYFNFNYDSRGSLIDYVSVESLNESLKKIVERLAFLQKYHESLSAEDRDVKLLRFIENNLPKIKAAMEHPEDFILNSKKDNFKGEVLIEIKSKYIHSAFRKIFRYPTVFMSATLLSKQGFKSLTGLSDSELVFVEVDSPFPAENRKMKHFWYPGSVALNYNNMSTEFPKVIERAKQVLRNHPEERGIIHAQSYQNAKLLMEGLRSEFGSRLIYPQKASEQKEALLQHERTPNGVLISPSMTEGVDLKDELCRFVILVKTPYLPLVDPVVNLRKDTIEDWYLFKSATTIMQAVGRGVRNEKDFAVTYCLDPAFGRFYGMSKHLFPAWFLDSWETSPCGGI